MGLVTDGPAFAQRRKIASLDLDRHMDVIVCTGELGEGCAKPSTVPFEVALTLLSIRPIEQPTSATTLARILPGPIAWE